MAENELPTGERYYINKRIDTLEMVLKEDNADLKVMIIEVKKLLQEHLTACPQQMCKLEEKLDKRLEPLESFRTKLIAIGTLILAVLGLAKFG